MRIGVFDILDTLGGGGGGTVYRARNETLGRIVAVKQLHKQVQEGDLIFERFRREAQLMASIRSDHVVTLYSYQIVDGKPLLEMECLGRNLEARMSQGPLDFREVLQIVNDVLLGLTALHTAGIVHRDVKPANVLEDEAGRLKLTDFGLSVVESDVRPTLEAATIRYVAPESVSENPACDFRSDLYSVGMVAYEAVLGPSGFRDAFPDLIPAAAFASKWFGWLKDSTKEATPLHLLRSDVPLPVSQFVARLMAKDPELRYGSADAALEALQSLTDIKAATPKARPRHSPRSYAGTGAGGEATGGHPALRAVGMTAAGVALAVGAIVLGVVLRREPAPQKSQATIAEKPGPKPAADERRLVATIVDEHGNGLLDVSLRLLPGNTTGRSDQNGRFTFAKLAPGAYEVTASLAGHESVVRKVTIESDRDASETFTLLSTEPQQQVRAPAPVPVSVPVRVSVPVPVQKNTKGLPPPKAQPKATDHPPSDDGSASRGGASALFYGRGSAPRQQLVDAVANEPSRPSVDGAPAPVNVGLRYKLIERLTTGREIEVDPEITFRSGDHVRFVFESNIDGFLYVVQQGSSGRWNVLFPSPQINGGANAITKFKEYAVPSSDSFVFNEQPGTEHLLVMLSKEPVAHLPGFGKPVTSLQTVAQTTVEEMSGSIRSRDLVFEKTRPAETVGGDESHQTQTTFVVNRDEFGQVVVTRINLVHQ